MSCIVNDGILILTRDQTQYQMIKSNEEEDETRNTSHYLEFTLYDAVDLSLAMTAVKLCDFPFRFCPFRWDPSFLYYKKFLYNCIDFPTFNPHIFPSHFSQFLILIETHQSKIQPLWDCIHFLGSNSPKKFCHLALFIKFQYCCWSKILQIHLIPLLSS